MLPMSIPSHCALMRPAAQEMQKQLEQTTLQTPNIPVLHNVDAKHHDDVSAIKGILAKQLYSPVRWVDTIRTLAAANVTHIAECGPGKVLAGLNKRIDRNLQSVSLTDNETVRQATTELK